MEKNINLSTATDKEREAYLLDHWHIESLSFVAEFHYDEVKQIGIIDNVYSSNGKRILKYPIIKDRPVRFKISKKLTSSWCSFNCVIAPEKIREATYNPFALSIVALLPIRKPDFIFTSTDGNANKPRTKTTITNRDDYSLVNDLPIDDKDRTDIGIVRWRLNLRKFSYISKFHIIISCKLIVYIVMCFYQETN